MEQQIRILIVAEDDPFCRSTCDQIAGTEDMVLVGQATEGPEALRLIRHARPDVVLLDLDLLGSSGPPTVAHIHGAYPDSKMLIVSEREQELRVLDTLREGALGHLVKTSSGPAATVEAIRTVHRGQSILSPGMAGWILDEITEERRQGNPRGASTPQGHSPRQVAANEKGEARAGRSARAAGRLRGRQEDGA